MLHLILPRYNFDQLGMAYEWVPAMDGRTIDESYLAREGIKMLPGEVVFDITFLVINIELVDLVKKHKTVLTPLCQSSRSRTTGAPSPTARLAASCRTTTSGRRLSRRISIWSSFSRMTLGAGHLHRHLYHHMCYCFHHHCLIIIFENDIRW